MKINCQKEDLLYGAQTVSRGISSKTTLPILSGMLICAENNKLTFRATDLEIAIECVINADIEEEGIVVIPGKYFLDIIRHLPDVSLSLSTNGNNQLIIYYGENQLNIRCFDPEEFPVLPQIEGDIKGSINSLVFKKMVKQVAVAASLDEVKPVFTGIWINITPGNITMVSTDTHRLAITKGLWQGDSEYTVILPVKTMQEIARLAVNNEDNIDVVFSNNQVYFSTGNITFVSRVISGQYPDYQQVLPKKEAFVTNIMINKNQLYSTLERASLLARDNNRLKGNIVKFKVEDDNLLITADSPDLGNIREQIAVTLSGTPMELVYNGRYLLDGLRVIDEENVMLCLTGPNTQGIIVPAEEQDYTYLVLPIRMGNY